MDCPPGGEAPEHDGQRARRYEGGETPFAKIAVGARQTDQADSGTSQRRVEGAGERVSPNELVETMRNLVFARVFFEDAFGNLGILAPHMGSLRLDVIANTNEKPADRGPHAWRELHDLVRGSAKKTKGLPRYLQENEDPSPALQLVLAVAKDVYDSGLHYLNASKVAAKNKKAQIEALAVTEYPYSAQGRRLATQAVLEGAELADGRMLSAYPKTLCEKSEQSLVVSRLIVIDVVC